MTNSVEFRTTIKQGIIEIPEEYKQELREVEEATVIVVKQSKRISPTGMMAELTQNPISVRFLKSRCWRRYYSRNQASDSLADF
jgi:hypothetical protein